MRTAGLMIRREATPLTPIAAIAGGTLRGSQFNTVYKDTGGQWSAEIGYTASYAPYVHEINKHYVAPGTQWKFLETAIFRRTADILALFGKELDVGAGAGGAFVAEDPGGLAGGAA
jgi:hypothetical protein